jgi:hypothetical protein
MTVAALRGCGIAATVILCGSLNHFFGRVWTRPMVAQAVPQ